MKHLRKCLALALVALSVFTVSFSAMAATTAGTVRTDPPVGNGGTLNLRATASSNATVLAYIPNGTRLQFTYGSTSDTWYRTSYSGKTGYVMSKFVLLDGSGGGGPSTVGVSWTTVQADTSGPLTTAIYANMSESSAVLATVNYPNYLQVKYATNNPQWVLAQVNGIQGYSPINRFNASIDTLGKAAFGSNLLRQGVNGQAVRNLQMYLTNAGFNTQGIDGDFGLKTKSAVIAFQNAKGLNPDGVVGANTRNALVEHLGW